MAKRAALAISSLALAAVLLLNFQGPETAAVAVATDAGGTKVAAVGSTSANAGSGTGGGSGTTGTAGSASPDPTTATAGKTVTVLGSLVSTRYGDVQVEVTIENGSITDVRAVALPTGGHSGRISDIVAPMLRTEALTAQSASIDVISGATYTSRAYATSLQAALDAAGL